MPLDMGADIWHDLTAMGGAGSVGGVVMTWAVGTDVGNERSVNEDAHLAAPPAFVVADGMGGHDAGDVASAMVVQRFARLAGAVEVSAGEVTAAIDDANESIFQAGDGSVDRSMGTTAVGLVLVENGPTHSWVLFNVGDSRAYRAFEGSLEMLSVDHSYVQELVDAGQLEPSAARTHPHRNVVTRALGVEGHVNSDVWVRLPVPGERFLLCSDGLTTEVDDDEIARVMLGVPEPEQAVSDLVRLALEHGGRDNVTVLVLDVEEVDGATLSASTTSPREDATGEHPLVLARPAQPVHALVDGAVVEVPQELRPDVDGSSDGHVVSTALIEVEPALGEVPGMIDDVPEWSGPHTSGQLPEFDAAPAPAADGSDIDQVEGQEDPPS